MAERIEVIPNEQFEALLPELVVVYYDSLVNTPPWNEVYSSFDIGSLIPITQQRFAEYQNLPGFCCVVAFHENKPSGITFAHETTVNEIHASKMFGDNGISPELFTYLNTIHSKTGISTICLITETVVAPTHQRQGVANKLRTAALDSVCDKHPEGVIFLTNHLSNNPHIIQSSTKLGFLPTGITNSNPEVDYYSEYWVKILL